MTPGFWKGRRVFLTGHTGFKGSWLSLWLQNLGADVVGFALPPPTEPSLFDLARVGAKMTSVIGDIRDASNLAAAVSDCRPEVVFHLAAQPLVRLSYEQPIETYATNVMGTVHLLEAVRRASSVRAVVNVTSDKCYQNREWPWGYRENEPMGGHDPYSSSKGCAELVTAAYRDSFFSAAANAASITALASARAGNVIGGGDWASDRLIPDIMRGFIAGRQVVVRNPDAIRPWQHVLESLSGYLTLAEKLWSGGAAFAEAWNFGPDDSDARPVRWIMEQVAASWDRADGWTIEEQESHHEATYLKLDSSKAKARLGWRPRWPLEQGLRAVNDWYMAYQAGHDMAQVTLNQINQYDDSRS